MSHTLTLTFLGLCLFDLGTTVGDSHLDRVNKVQVHLIDATQVERGRPARSCTGSRELHRHEPWLILDPDEWSIKDRPGERPDPLIDLQRVKVTVLGDSSKEWVHVPRRDIHKGAKPDGSSRNGPPEEFQWVPSLQKVLHSNELEPLEKCFDGLANNPCFITEVEILGGKLVSSKIGRTGRDPAVWDFVRTPEDSDRWSQAMTEHVTLTLRRNDSVEIQLQNVGAEEPLTLVSTTPRVEVWITNQYADDSDHLDHNHLKHFRWFYEILGDDQDHDCLAPFHESAHPESPGGIEAAGSNAFCPPASWDDS